MNIAEYPLWFENLKISKEKENVSMQNLYSLELMVGGLKVENRCMK